MNFFKLYIGDYQRDTAHLSVTEHGAYMLMLQHYYATEKPLPVGKALHRMLRAQDKAEREAIDTVASQFWRETEAGLVNDRADAELVKASTQAETNRAIAQAREDKRRQTRQANEKSTNRATNDQPNHSQTPDTRHQEGSSEPSPRARVGQALKRAGIDLASNRLDDPRLVALVEQGATPEEFEAIGREALERGIARPIGWICTTLAGRRADAAKLQLAPAPQPTVPSDAAAATAELLERQRHANDDSTPESRARAEEARAKLAELTKGMRVQ